MNITRGIALCGLTLAIALAIGAISPMQPYASAGRFDSIIIIATPALAIPEQPAAAPTPEQLPPTAPPEISPAAAPLAEQLPPAAPPEQPAAPVVEQPAAPVVEQPAAPVVELVPLEALHCPCNVLEAETPAQITERQRQQSRQRTR
jgi:hypothetical protein